MENVKITIQNPLATTGAEDAAVSVDGGRGIRSSATQRKGRGFVENKKQQQQQPTAMEIDTDGYDTLGEGAQGKYQRSVEGWIVFVTGVHEEAQEDAVTDKFAEYGELKNIHLNLDRRTGFVKGYAMVEFAKFEEAKMAVDALNGSELYGQTIHCDFAFLKAPLGAKSSATRTRSASPAKRR